MPFERLFRPRPAVAAGRALFTGAVAQARRPAFYTAMATPDTVEGRFELYSLHVVLLIDRLSRQGQRASETAQALFDAYLRSLDDALREMGVGDLSVGKKMRKLGEAFYGRVKSYEGAIQALPEREKLSGLLTRTVYAGTPEADPTSLADYMLAAREVLKEQSLETILAGEATWPTI
jgi:cytochrome b pre-mRNA-processing protein 3